MSTVKIEVSGDIKDAFTKIALISKESMIEQSSKAGNKVRVNSRASLVSSSTNWRQVYKRVRARRDGSYNRKTRRIQKGFPQSTGKRVAHRSGGGIDNPSNMANFITSKTFESSGTTVVGGGHKSFTPNKIRDGKVVGIAPKVRTVTQRSIAILDKLNDGEVDAEKREYLQWRTKDGGYSSKSIAQFEGKWKARRFMEAGYAASRGYIKSSMTTELERLVGKRVNTMKTKKESYVA